MQHVQLTMYQTKHHYSSHQSMDMVVMIFIVQRRTLFMLCLGLPWAQGLGYGGCGPSPRLLCLPISLNQKVVSVSEEIVAYCSFSCFRSAFIPSPRSANSWRLRPRWLHACYPKYRRVLKRQKQKELDSNRTYITFFHVWHP